ncbi:ArsR/SmtB family transcription factor [Verrucomicrobiota bacterium]
MAQAEKLARVFKVLSVGTRVRIVQLLKTRTMCVNALARSLKISPAAVSQHLRILRDAEIVTARKRGYFVHYRVSDKTLARWHDLADVLLTSEPANSHCVRSRLKEQECSTGKGNCHV